MELEQKREFLKILRIFLCTMVSSLSSDEIASTTGSELLIEKFVEEALCRTKKAVSFQIDTERARSSVTSIIGNMEKCARDLHDSIPDDINMKRLSEWDARWRVEKERSKRARHIDTQCLLSKKMRMEQARHALFVEDEEVCLKKVSNSQLPSTLRNCECTLTIGIPNDAILPIKSIGSGEYGDCQKVQIKGISFLPESIFYAAKRYKGSPEHRLKSFEKEISIDLRHEGIVRSIGHTRSPPWVAIFPFFNGGSIGSILQSLPYNKGTFVRAIQKLKGGGKTIIRSKDPELSPAEISRVHAFCNNAPNIIAAIVHSMMYAHSQGVVHCDIHPLNIMLDFTKDNLPRIGIIDWGLALRYGYEKRTSLTPIQADHNIRPWLAPELIGKANDMVYTRAVDVYALSWMILQVCTFCTEFDAMYETGWNATRVASDIQHIELIVKIGYYIRDRFDRKNLDELDSELQRMGLDHSKCLRPMSEMMPAFY